MRPNRKIKPKDWKVIIRFVKRLMDSGVGISEACRAVGIDRASYYYRENMKYRESKKFSKNKDPLPWRPGG